MQLRPLRPDKVWGESSSPCWMPLTTPSLLCTLLAASDFHACSTHRNEHTRRSRSPASGFFGAFFPPPKYKCLLPRSSLLHGTSCPPRSLTVCRLLPARLPFRCFSLFPPAKRLAPQKPRRTRFNSSPRHPRHPRHSSASAFHLSTSSFAQLRPKRHQ